MAYEKHQGDRATAHTLQVHHSQRADGHDGRCGLQTCFSGALAEGRLYNLLYFLASSCLWPGDNRKPTQIHPALRLGQSLSKEESERVSEEFRGGVRCQGRSRHYWHPLYRCRLTLSAVHQTTGINSISHVHKV